MPHEADEGLAWPLREIREESNQVSEIGDHPKESGKWLGMLRGGYFGKIKPFIVCRRIATGICRSCS